jgi:TonB-dependent starch-binding outer membrane protein SusC
MRLFFFISCLLLVLFGFAQQQTPITISGRIVAAKDSAAVASATITIKQLAAPVITNNNGLFTLQVSSLPVTLTVTHIGFTTQRVMVTTASSNLLVLLQETSVELNEVVVNTGYQKLPKERATGSFTHISKELFNEQVGTNVLDRLKHISNGVVPISDRIGGNAKGRLLIRGLSTLTLSIQKPLIILDNFEYQGDLENINPNDVEQVTFLKDAAAASIWGAKAANGVIVITTKKATVNQPMRVEFNSSVLVSEEPDLFALPLMSTSEIIDIESYLFGRGFYNARINAPKQSSLSPVVAILNRQRLGQLTQQQAETQINAFRGLDVRNSYLSEFYSPAVNQQYALSLSGGSHNHAWLISGGYDRNKTEVSGRYNRGTLRFDNQYKLHPKVELNSSLYLVQQVSVTGKPGWNSIRTRTGELPQYMQFTDDKGQPAAFYIDAFDKSYIDTAGAGLLLNWQYYPATDYKEAATTSRTLNINAVAGIQYKPFSFLSVDVKYRYQQQQSETELLQTQQSYYTRNLINSFSQVNYANRTVTYPVPKGDIIDMSNGLLSAHNLRIQADVQKKWNDHQLVMLAGGETGSTVNRSHSFRTYGFNQETYTRVNVDFANQYPNFITNARSFIPNASAFSRTTLNIVSLYSNAAYTFRNRYSFSISARRDASNVFGLNTNDKWNPLWSAGLGWVLSDETFYNATWLPYLKLRLTYGKQGNLDPSAAAVTTVGYVGTNPFTATPYGQIQNFYNPDLRWEQVRMLNAGVDLRVFNGRISGSIEYYNKQMSDLYGLVPIDPTTGLARRTITKNIAAVSGHGVDVIINSSNTTGAVKWSSIFIINYYKDKVTRNEPLPQTGAYFAGGGLLALEGNSPFTYFAHKFAGLDPANGDPQGYLNGQLSKNYNALINEIPSSQLANMGTMMPVLFGSVGNTVQWKGLSLSVRLSYSAGYYFRRTSINYGNLVRQLAGHSDYSKRWQKPGDERNTTVPSFVYPANNLRDEFYSLSSALATKGDHVRLRYINLSYQFGKPQWKKLPFKQVHVYSIINNVGIIYRANQHGLDPDFGGIPAARNIAAGLRIVL